MIRRSMGASVTHQTCLLSQTLGHEDPAFRTYSRLPDLIADATAQVDDVPSQPGVRPDSDDEPFQANGLISKDWPSEAKPKLQPNHRSVLREMRSSECHQQASGMCPTRNGALIACSRRIVWIMVHRIQIPYVVRKCRDRCQRQLNFRSETLVRSDLHLGL